MTGESDAPAGAFRRDGKVPLLGPVALSVESPGHGSRVLLGLESLETLVSTPDGIEVRWRCTCGERGAWATKLPAGVGSR